MQTRQRVIYSRFAPSVAAAIIVFCVAQLAGAAATEAVEQGTLVRDRIWVWTNAEVSSGQAQTLASYAQASPSQRAALLDLPNVILGGMGMPNEDDAAIAITRAAASARQLVWKIAVDGELITSGKDGKSGYAWYDQRTAQVRMLVDQFPQINGVMIDDLSTVGLRGGIKAEHIDNLRNLLGQPDDRIRIWGELYTASLNNFILRPSGKDYGLTDAVRALDVIVLTEWNAADLPKLAQNVAACRRIFPNKELVLNIVLYDYDGQRRMPLALLEYQCDQALRMLHAGQINGIIITATLNDPPALKWTAAWLKGIGDQELGGSTATTKQAEVPAPDPATLPGPDEPLDISKIYFMYHPICWSMQMQGDVPGKHIPKPHDVFLETFAREVAVVKRQKQLMREMKPDEVMVIFPNGYSRAMFIIEQYATEILGRRCIIIKGVHPGYPSAWNKLDNPVGSLLDDETLEGRDEWFKDVPPQLVKELLAEIREANAKEGIKVGLPAVEVAFTSRIFAHEILEKMEDRRLRYAANVSGESFGEGFEECAMTWKQMLVPYLGIEGSVPNQYDLSVSGAKFLLRAELKERLPLANDIFLYLWEDEQGSPIGMFARARCRITDSPYYVNVQVEDPKVEVWGYGGAKFYPREGATMKPVEGKLRLNVFSAIRREPDGLFYLRGGADTTYAQFKQNMLDAAIVQ
jgi:hypothetical protein